MSNERNQKRFIIPADTSVDLRNLLTGRREVGYRTKKELVFSELTDTGLFGDAVIYYFTFEGEWLITVTASKVE